MAPRARLTAALTSHADVDSPSRAGLDLWSHDAKRRRGDGGSGEKSFLVKLFSMCMTRWRARVGPQPLPAACRAPEHRHRRW